MLYFSVSPRPFNKSTIKKRLSLRANFGFGTFTNGIASVPIPSSVFWSLVFGLGSLLLQPRSRWVAKAKDPRPKTKDLSPNFSRHCRLTFRQIHQPNISSLRLQVEIPRAPIESRQQPACNKQPNHAKHNHDRFAGRAQVQATAYGVDSPYTFPSVQRLHQKDRER